MHSGSNSIFVMNVRNAFRMQFNPSKWMFGMHSGRNLILLNECYGMHSGSNSILVNECYEMHSAGNSIFVNECTECIQDAIQSF
jgi:hypothetical protein